MTESLYPPSEARGIWVFLEHDAGQLAPVSLEIAGKARSLAGQIGAEVTGLLLGDGVERLAEQAAGLGLDRVLRISHPLLAPFTAEPFARAAREAILTLKPDILLLGATPYGRDLAGRLAVLLRTGLTADCTDLLIDERGLLVGEVSGFGGGIVANIVCERHRPQMATVRPGVFPQSQHSDTPPAAIESFPIDLPDSAAPVRVVARHAKATADLSAADRLVIAGRGTRGQVGLIEALANALHAEVGATRVAVDQGWLPRERQIGQTGTVARPKLAIVCGASGASQFTVGIEGAELIVAVNDDAEAPIFEQADLCIVDDLFPVVRALLAELESDGGAR